MSAAPTARPRTRRAPTFLSSYARTLTNGGLRFHTDRTDVVGFLVRAPGAARAASARSPPRPPSTTRSWPSAPTCSTRCSPIIGAAASARKAPARTARARAGRRPIRCRSSACATFGKFTSHYSLTFIEAAQLAPDVPKLSAAQKEAIDVLMTTAQELCFEMTLEPGDLQLINSHVTYHGRTPFEDDASSGHDRLLLRDLAHHAQQPAAAGRSRDPVAQHRGRPTAQQSPAGDAVGRSTRSTASRAAAAAGGRCRLTTS